MMWRVLSNWAWLQRSQWLSKDELTKIQTQKLKETVYHAYRNVPFYQQLYRAKALDPASITDLRSITKLPTITKEDLTNSSLQDRVAVDYDINSCVRRTTSGSTGVPTAILLDYGSLCYRPALWLRKFWVYGWRPQSKVCISIPGEAGTALFSSMRGLLGFLLRYRIKELPLAAEARDNLDFILAWKPDLLATPTSHFRALIRLGEEGERFPVLKIALPMSEMLDSSIKKLISDKFQADVFETYGLAEVGGVAWECPTRSGQHINAESLIVEFLKDGEPVGSGESGEVCVTDLYNRATPLIRYRVGDMAVPLDEECGCDRGLPLLRNLEGRVLDHIITEDGRQVSPFTIMRGFEGIPGIAQYKVTQKRDHSIEVLVRSSETKAEAVLQLVQERCMELFPGTPVSIRAVDAIQTPKEPAKLRIVESEVQS